ncbi:hypothetical protein ATN88_16035 [Enterovibrio coralii]|uniref:Integrase catalytic domain-containing protein n=2 Tax=Enterovibrio coralii TaxID=294935 RepID=A0A135I5V6_9GAMM|nr:hypothetical protein ATN88_16035 [Enterovibrio coralii]
MDLTMLAITKAVRSRKPKHGLSFHTDRSREYCVGRVRYHLSGIGVMQNRNRSGRCTDNAEVESFLKTLKGDLIKDVFIGRLVQLEEQLRRYVDYFYNRSRLHGSMGYIYPIAF